MSEMQVALEQAEHPWGPREMWTCAGARAVGECRAYVDANPDARCDALLTKAGHVANSIDFNIITEDIASDVGLEGGIHAVITAMLFEYMQERREYLKTRRELEGFWARERGELEPSVPKALEAHGEEKEEA